MAQKIPQIRNQMYISPELVAIKIERKPHEARFFKYIADVLNLNLYKRFITGALPYSRRILIAVILYAMYKGYYSARSIIKFSEDSIGATWILNGMDMPGYKTVERTINDFIEEIDNVFVQILSICEKLSLIGKERIYMDGVKIKANASKHKAMSYSHLTKKITKGNNDLELLYSELKSSIDCLKSLSDIEMNELIKKESKKVHDFLRKEHEKALKIKEEETFNIDLNPEENKEKSEINYDILNKKSKILKSIDDEEKYENTLEKLNNVAFIEKRVNKMEDAKIELENKWKEKNGTKKIPEKKQINFTDSNSAIMVTKHQGVQQCYNNFAIVDDKSNIILGTHTNNNASDQLGLIPAIEDAKKLFGSLEGFQFGADAGFFSAENILYLEENKIDYYISFPESKSRYGKDKFVYDSYTDTYKCPEGNILTMQKQLKSGKVREYSNKDACASCDHRDNCTRAKDGMKKIERDMINDNIREQAREKARSPEGREVLRLRKTIPEPVWGNIKTQDGLIQLHYRGNDKTSPEFKLHCIMQNLRKILKVYFNSKSYQVTVHNVENEKQLSA